jgi:hypothetical protein
MAAEKRLIEEYADFIPNPQHHILLSTYVKAPPRVEYNFQFEIGVSEETFRLLQDPENTPVKAEIANKITSRCTKRMLELAPIKCLSCGNDAVLLVFSGTILNTTAVPTIFNPICFGSCEACEQTVHNAGLNAVLTRRDIDRRCFKACADCGKCALKMDCCSLCRCAFYCNRSCQRHHWRNGHKQVCKKYRGALSWV